MQKRNLFFAVLILFAFSCNVTENIQDGATAYKLKKYALAAGLLQKDFRQASTQDDKAKIAYEIGQSYQFDNQIEQAADWYKQSMDLGYGSDAILGYANMLKEEQKYDDAVLQYNAYLKEEPYRRPEMTIQINSCNQASDWIKQQNDEYEKDMYVTDLDINSPQSDFNPVLYQSNTILFTSSRSSATGTGVDKWTGDKYYDLYSMQMNGVDNFSVPELFAGPFNSDYNDGAPAFSKEFNEMFFTRCGSDNRKIDDYCNLYYSSYEPDAGWSDPQILQFFEDSMNIGTAALSPDGQTLFFSATNPDGYGGSDIYMSKKLNEGWDAPVNAGTGINTAGNEVFPYFGPDGTFYFSSDGQPGMGGLDLFSAQYKNGKFSRVTNMQYPINSGGDDFGILLLDHPASSASDTLEVGYFSSSRPGGKGEDDIYLFVKKKKKLHPAVFVLDGKVLQKVYEDPTDPSSKVLDTIPLPASSATIAFEDNTATLGKFTVKDDGKFALQVDSMQGYKITGTKDKYFTNSILFSTKEAHAKPGDTIHLYAEVVLDKIPEKTTTQIKLNNIYYDFNDTTLRAESFPELDKLVKLLDENPTLTIQINSHTDSRGTDKYNIRLSQGRANSVVAYLIQKGIDPKRLVAKGFGESMPEMLNSDELVPGGDTIPKGTQLNETFINKYKKNKEEFEFLNQLNRRTTFNILSSDFNIQSGRPDEIKSDKDP